MAACDTCGGSCENSPGPTCALCKQIPKNLREMDPGMRVGVDMGALRSEQQRLMNLGKQVERAWNSPSGIARLETHDGYVLTGEAYNELRKAKAELDQINKAWAETQDPYQTILKDRITVTYNAPPRISSVTQGDTFAGLLYPTMSMARKADVAMGLLEDGIVKSVDEVMSLGQLRENSRKKAKAIDDKVKKATQKRETTMEAWGDEAIAEFKDPDEVDLPF